ncbi:MAG: hypothetical protein SangKO_063830 [Sandaracinaceae bacterium]
MTPVSIAPPSTPPSPSPPPSQAASSQSVVRASIPARAGSRSEVIEGSILSGRAPFAPPIQSNGPKRGRSGWPEHAAPALCDSLTYPFPHAMSR